MADFSSNGSGLPLRESFDRYTNIEDAAQGPTPIWNASGNEWLLVEGRFPRSQALGSGTQNESTTFLDVGSIGTNAASILFGFAFIQTRANLSPLVGDELGIGVQFLDGAGPQCTMLFRVDGSVVLTGGDAEDSIVATFEDVFSQNTWTSIQGEIVVHDSAGSLKLWIQGQTGDPGSVTPDFSATSLNTRGASSHNYANNIRIVTGAGMRDINNDGVFANSHRIDDFRAFDDSGSAPNELTGDLMSNWLPAASDSSIDFTAEELYQTELVHTIGSALAATNTALYTKFIPERNFDIKKVEFVLSSGTGANIKLALFDSDGLESGPGTLLSSLGTITGATVGVNQLVVASPPAVEEGHVYWIGIDQNTSCSYTAITNNTSEVKVWSSSTTYGSFPASNPALIPVIQLYVNFALISSKNFSQVSELTEDGLTSYVRSANAGDVDQYTISPLPSVPAYIDAVITWGFVNKNEAGLREAQIHLDSGGTGDDSPSTPLTSTFGYIGKCYTEDPDTSTAWTYSGVNAILVGPKVSV